MYKSGIVLNVVPGFAERRLTELILPFLKPEQIVVFFCCVLGGALEFYQTLKLQGVKEFPLIAETEALLYGAGKRDEISVRVTSRKENISLSALPARHTNRVLSTMNILFNDLFESSNVIETGLRNIDTILHPPISILNAANVDSTSRPFKFYKEGVTESIGKVMELLDVERKCFAEAFDIVLPSVKDCILKWYGKLGASGNKIWEVVAMNPVYQSVNAPKTLNHRFIVEDVAFGLVPIEELSKLFDIQTPITTALIALANRLVGMDFRAGGRTLRNIGLAGATKEEMRALVR
jgi:opine dehydrogenase